jgi:tRNA (adenine37-N6)-methyltransferase
MAEVIPVMGVERGTKVNETECEGMMELTLNPIGIVHSPFKNKVGMPIQPIFAEDIEGTVDVLPQYADGLRDLEGFERIWLIYWLHKAEPCRLRVVPFRDTTERGVFATRAPCRPTAIGLSCVRLLSFVDNVLRIGGVDILDGTPLLDIKPYVPKFDSFPESSAGWFDQSLPSARTHADSRFE